MLRVTTGHYRDVFCGKVYDVRRDMRIEGTHTRRGWTYTLPNNGVMLSSRPIFTTKEKAAFAARCEIGGVMVP